MALIGLVTLALLGTSSAFHLNRDEVEDPVLLRWPSVVQIESQALNGWATWSQTCVGSILNNRYILTAASCFSDPAFDVTYSRIRAGANYRNTGGFLYNIERVIKYTAPEAFALDNEDGNGEDGNGEDGNGEEGNGEDGNGEDGNGEDGNGEDSNEEDNSEENSNEEDSSEENGNGEDSSEENGNGEDNGSIEEPEVSSPLTDDIAVLRLATTLIYNNLISQATIAAPGSLIPPGVRLFQLGWDKAAPSGALVESSTFTVEKGVCGLTEADNSLCVQVYGEDDNSNPGSPLFFEYITVGVLAGFTNGTSSYVSADVGSYTEWIISVAV